MFKIGDKVRVVQIVDDVGDYLRSFIGEIGVVVKTGNGQSVEDMISVKFDNEHDAFWPEELEFAR